MGFVLTNVESFEAFLAGAILKELEELSAELVERRHSSHLELVETGGPAVEERESTVYSEGMSASSSSSSPPALVLLPVFWLLAPGDEADVIPATICSNALSLRLEITSRSMNEFFSICRTSVYSLSRGKRTPIVAAW